MHNAILVHSTTDGEALIAYMARVSNPANQDNPDYEGLIRYLIRHKHWSPMEMVSMCVKIETTRSIAAQILRHRSFSFQEFSQRYAKVAELPVVPELRRQDLKNRQNSIADLDEETTIFYEGLMEEHNRRGYDLYNQMVEKGIAKECAREVLPMGSPTTLYMHGTLRSWLHYCDLRCDNGTQKEHRMIADSCKELIRETYPTVYAAMWGQD